MEKIFRVHFLSYCLFVFSCYNELYEPNNGGANQSSYELAKVAQELSGECNSEEGETMAQLWIVQDGVTLKGTPCFYLDSDEGVNQYGVEIEEDDHFAGFFHSADEAREWAARKGHEIIDEE